MTDIKYSFFDQPFDVSTENVKIQTTGAPYVELVYPRDNNKPVLSYNNLMFYPSRLVIARSSSSPTVDYVLYLETVNSSNVSKLFINMMLKHDETKPDGDLTQLFNQIKINTATAKPAIVNLNSLFGAPSVTHKINKNTSADLTLYINDVITTKIANVKAILTNTSNFSVTEKFPTFTQQNTNPKDVLLIYSHLTQRQRCTRSTDNASKTVAVVNQPTTSSVQTNILVLVILGLCVAAFFPSIYYGLVCLPAGGDTHHAKIHLIYLIGALSMVIPLFVRGFRDGDPAAQVWGIGIIVLVLIFGWQYVDLSRKLILKCDGTNTVLSGSIISHLSKGTDDNSIFLFILILFPFWVSALAMSSNGEVFSGLLAGQAIITVIAILLNKYYK